MTLKTETETKDSSIASWPLWQPPPGLPEPAREVWLAGLGALARAQAEGGKAFEALVRQGLTLQTQASEVAQAHIAEAAQAATQPWQHLSDLGNLGSLFESRVERALAHLGLPTAHDWNLLQARVRALETALQDAGQAEPQVAEAPARAVKPSAKAGAKPSVKAKPRATHKSPRT